MAHTQFRVELYAAIRRDARAGMTEREIQRTHHVGWRTVKAALDSAWPAERAAYPTRASKLDPFKDVIDEILVGDLDAPRKQRHTATRIFARLIDEHGMTNTSYPVLRAYVAKRKPEIRVEHGRGDPGGFVPQTHLPGREAEVDCRSLSLHRVASKGRATGVSSVLDQCQTSALAVGGEQRGAAAQNYGILDEPKLIDFSRVER